LLYKRNNPKHRQNNHHKTTDKPIKSVSNVDCIDERDSQKKRNHTSPDASLYLSCKWPEVDIIDTKPYKKPITNKSRKQKHSHKFHLCGYSLDGAFSFDVEYVIAQSEYAHTKECKQQNISFLSVDECVIDEIKLLDDERKSYHHSHNQQEESSSHSRCPSFVLMKFSKYRSLLSVSSLLTQLFSSFSSLEEGNVWRIEHE